MNVQKRIKCKDETTSILDLPTEVIEYICSSDVLNTNDVFNLAVAHSKLNDCLFHEQNPFLWKSKYVQRYGQLDKDEYEIVIDEQNTWKDEIMLRMRLDKAVAAEIALLPCMYMKFKNVPYHMYPFSEPLNSKNQGHRYYVLYASIAYYKHLLKNKNFKNNYDLLYIAHHFLIYSCQVYFGYKIVDFLSLPSSKQTVERGFYLLGRWWCPTDSTPYQDICKQFDNIAMTVCHYIQSKNPSHPLVGLESSLERVRERGKTNLDHDLFDEISTCFILNCIREVVFAKSQMLCNCNHEINCFLLQPVMVYKKGSLFLLCVLYEAIARRLGVNVKLTATSVHKFVSWSSSWPKNKHKDPTCYVIDIASGGDMREATVCPVSRKLPERYNGNSLHDLFSTFCTIVEGIAYNNLSALKYVLDFQKLFKVDDPDVEFKCQKFHEYHDYCRCPLLRDASNPRAPNHENERNMIYPFWEEIFPLTPKIRGSCFDTSYSVGMVVNIGTHINESRVLYSKRGIIVGWTRVPIEHPMYHEQHKYYVIISYKASDNTVMKYPSPAIEVVQPHDEMQRQLKPIAEDFNIIGKFFKYYSQELCAFVPIDELARLYPDDLSFAKMDIKTPITKIYSS